MTKLEKVMRGLECCIQAEGPELCDQCPYEKYLSPCRFALMCDAQALLRDQIPRVMKRKEIEDSDGSEFYSEHRDEEYMYLDHTEGPAYIMGNIDRLTLTKLRWADYGKTWRCWTSRPTPEQRANTPWEGSDLNG